MENQRATINTEFKSWLGQKKALLFLTVCTWRWLILYLMRWGSILQGFQKEKKLQFENASSISERILRSGKVASILPSGINSACFHEDIVISCGIEVCTIAMPTNNVALAYECVYVSWFFRGMAQIVEEVQELSSLCKHGNDLWDGSQGGEMSAFSRNQWKSQHQFSFSPQHFRSYRYDTTNLTHGLAALLQ